MTVYIYISDRKMSTRSGEGDEIVSVICKEEDLPQDGYDCKLYLLFYAWFVSQFKKLLSKLKS